MRRLASRWIGIAAAAALAAAAAAQAPPGGFDPRAFGAKGDGEAKDTAAIQKAIDAAAEHGGTVRLGPGVYLSGTLHLKSGIAIELETGATLKGSPDVRDYDPRERLPFKNAADQETSCFHFALLAGEDLKDVAIVGRGTIDGNREKRGGPKPIALRRCRGIKVKDVTIRNAPNYNISMIGCEDALIDGVTILDGHCDGIDPDCCRNVVISNCHIETWDDAIVCKTSFALGERRATENVAVSNCLLATACNGFKLGTESGGDFKRIAVSNCVMTRYLDHPPQISGIALESVDGSNIDGVVVSNVAMVDVRAPIYIRLGNRGRDMPEPIPGTLRNVLIENVAASGASFCSSITGLPGHPVEGVTISNVRVGFLAGDPDMKFGAEVEEKPAAYPDADMFDALPAYGLYCRHADQMKLSGLQFYWDRGAHWRTEPIPESKRLHWIKEPGPAAVATPSGCALACDDVQRLQLEGLAAMGPPSAGGLGEGRAFGPGAVADFCNVRDALVRGCSALELAESFLRVRGPLTRNLTLEGNDFGRVNSPIQLDSGLDPEEIRSIANRTR